MNKLLDGLEYERYCAEWLKKQGYHNVQLTKASGDQGIDIIAYKMHKKYGFQCKYYAKPVGNEAVQQAFCGAAFYHCDIASVITNTTFTKSALALAEETDVELYENINPSSFHIIPLFYRLYSTSLIIIGICFLFMDAENRSDFMILTSCNILLSGISGVFYTRFYGCMISALFAALALILGFFSISAVLKTVLLLYLLLQLIHLVILHKQRNLSFQSTVQDELKEEIRRSTMKIGEHLQNILQDELHCDIQLCDAEHISREILEFTFQAGRNVTDDIPLTEYSLNQTAKYEDSDFHYEIHSVSQRTFILKMIKEM